MSSMTGVSVLNTATRFQTASGGAVSMQTCWDVVHAIALLVHRNVASLAKDDEVWGKGEAATAHGTQCFLVLCAPCQHILQLPCQGGTLHANMAHVIDSTDATLHRFPVGSFP